MDQSTSTQQLSELTLSTIIKTIGDHATPEHLESIAYVQAIDISGNTVLFPIEAVGQATVTSQDGSHRKGVVTFTVSLEIDKSFKFIKPK